MAVLDPKQLRQEILDSAILHAMNQALDEKILEESVVMALEQIRSLNHCTKKKRIKKRCFEIWFSWTN